MTAGHRPGTGRSRLLGDRIRAGAWRGRIRVATIARWVLGELRIPRLELYVEPWNQASIRTVEKAGFRREGLLRSWQAVGGERKDMFMYSMLPAEIAANAVPEP